ncbi:DUF5658 family protein [Halobium salinum]|uniref:DUF5658 family protein n=1 Tax=Halobium salinum TaxID=1364940 RepID=A0ABD5PC21_9EURY|nr:DUF5658 family protein [Halobium salinum]
MSSEHLSAAERLRWTADDAPHRDWWLVAVALFGVGDLLLTLVGLLTGWAVEAHPLVGRLVATHGVWVLVPLKLAVIGVFYGLYRAAPREIRVGVPLGLALLGGLVVAWNVYVLFVASGLA